MLLKKNLKLRCFKSNQDEIFQDCFSSTCASIDVDVSFHEKAWGSEASFKSD